MTETYIVLRTEEVVVPTTENVGIKHALSASTLRRRTGVTDLTGLPKAGLEAVSLSTADVDDLRRDPRTIAIAPPMPVHLVEPQDTFFSDHWHITANGNTWGVEAVGAHVSRFDGQGVVVAVLDTGIDPNHPAFRGVELIRRNFTSENPDDSHGHGTHCAGTIFGRSVNGVRIGVAPGTKTALIAKVLGEGAGSSATLAHAINWAVQNGANVVSMSLGIDFPGYVRSLIETRNLRVEPATSIALSGYRANINLFSRITDFLEAQSAFQRGVAVVAASGNESNRPDYVIAAAPPAAATGIISVGALRPSRNGYEVAPWSNTECNISAPGVAVMSAAFNNASLTAMSGTSMAAPHVAGVMALWAQKELNATGNITAGNIVARTLGNATRIGLPAGSQMNDFGAGIAQAP